MTATQALETDLPVSQADPFGEDVLRDPWSFHKELREAGPVVYLEKYDTYALGRHDEVRAALVNWQLLQSAAGVGLSNFRLEKPWRPPSLLLEADPPAHDAPRAVLSKIMSSRRLRRLRDSWFTDAQDLLEEVLQNQEFDAVTDVASRFPLRVFPDALGMAEEGRENLLPYGDHVFNAFGPVNPLVEKGLDRVAELSAWVADQCQREKLIPGGFGSEIWDAADRGDISHEQAPLIVRSLLTAGVDTTVHGISSVIASVATHPNAWQQLRENRSLIRIAFDEAVRLHSPVQTFFRTTTAPVNISGTVIPADKKVLMFLGSANRDPRRWENPDVFDLSRDPSGHVGFGMGVHQCVGQHIARLEAEAILNALLDRVRMIELTGPLVPHFNNTLNGFDSVPVRVELA